ncbi:MAG: hypothetical protein QOH88_1199 [Verrucomicrobiota bacterium]
MSARITNLHRIAVVLFTATIVSVDAETVKTDDGRTISVSAEVGRLIRDGGSALQNGRYEQAIAHFTAALGMRPEKEVAAVIYDKRAEARLNREDAAGTLADANEAIRLDGRMASAYSKRGLVYRRQGNSKQAIEEFNAALRLNPNLAYVYNNRGLIYSDMGRSDAAIRDFTHAIQCDPNYANAYNNRAIEYSKLGRNEQALADYDEAIRRDPNVENSHINRAFLLEKMGDSQRAAADYDRVIIKAPRGPDDYVARGYALSEKGDYARAASDYRRALELAPTHRVALNALAWLQATCPDASLRNGKEALRNSRTVCELTRWQDGDYLDTFAAACAEVGDFENAVRHQTQVVSMANTAGEDRNAKQKRLALYREGKPYRSAR